MSSKFLAIDIKSDLITAIVFNVEAKVMHIEGHTVVSVADRPMEEVLTELSRKIDLHETSCHIALAADSFFFRNLSLPFTDRKTIDKILPLELEENAPVKIERLLIDSIIVREDSQKSQVIAAMIDRELLANQLATLQALGIDPQTVTISGIPTTLRLIHTPELPADFLLLNISLQQATLIVVRSGQIILIRPLVFDPGLQSGFHADLDNNTLKVFRPENIDDTFQALCTAIQQTLHSVFQTESFTVYLSGPVGCMQGTRERIQAGLGNLCRSCTLADANQAQQFVPQFVPPVDKKWLPNIMEDSVNLGWQIIKSWKGFNFRKESFASKKSFSDKRTLTIAITLPLVAAALFSISYLWVDYSKLLKEQNSLDTQIRAVFTETLPEVTRIVDPIQQLQVKIRETRESSMDKDGTLPTITMLDILTEISANIPESLDVRLARFVVDENGLRLKGTTDTFNTVDAIKKGLEQSPAFSNVEISAANLDPKSSKIRFELKLTMKGV
ncbi:MAG: PilN domain-containing protein [Proteobacteria bacterium]|nr:PilN domain-containing protein [Pseudomonadota bacterium]MBU1650274.1 PilN domain-containing protein [Pseudomonadota bacterium]